MVLHVFMMKCLSIFTSYKTEKKTYISKSQVVGLLRIPRFDILAIFGVWAHVCVLLGSSMVDDGLSDKLYFLNIVCHIGHGISPAKTCRKKKGSCSNILYFTKILTPKILAQIGGENVATCDRLYSFRKKSPLDRLLWRLSR